MVYQLGTAVPKIARSSYIADSAEVIGNVEIREHASVWMGAVLRGDIEAIVLGRESNVQENCSLHTSHGLPLYIGEQVTIGHSVTLHSCRIGDRCLIGMGTTVLDGAEIGNGSIVGAGAVVPPGSKLGPNSLFIGSPARWKKELGAQKQAEIVANARRYVELAVRYQSELRPLEISAELGTKTDKPGHNAGQNDMADCAFTEQQWKLIVYVPRSAGKLLEKLKEALFAAGAGQLGCYRRCSWQSSGLGQFEPMEGSHPAIEGPEPLCLVKEDKLEMLCPFSALKNALDALYAIHPYERPAYEIYPVFQAV